MHQPEKRFFRETSVAILLMAGLAISGCKGSESDSYKREPIGISFEMIEAVEALENESTDDTEVNVEEDTIIESEDNAEEHVNNANDTNQEQQTKSTEDDEATIEGNNEPIAQEKVYSTAMSFNLLGFSHTDPPISRDRHKGYEDGRTRYIEAVQWMYDRGVEVASLQERQKQQLIQHLSNKRTLKLSKEDGGGKVKIKERFGIYPAESFGLSSQAAVMWDKTRYEFVSGRMVKGHEYFHGAARSFPETVLRDRITGVEITIRAIHDPADVRGDAQRFRDDNQIDHREALKAAVIEDENLMIMGDFNEGLSADANITKPEGVSNVCSLDDECKLREDARSIDKAFVANDENFEIINFRTTKGPKNQEITDHPKLPIFKFAVVEEQE